MKKFTFITLLLLYTTSSSLFSQINPEDITIVRDTFGTPHIYGKTDAHTAYGLAWAHAEDDFNNLQKMIAMSRGRLAEIIGLDGVGSDYFYGFTRVRELVEERYDSELSDGIKDMVSGYVQGLNAYAEKHHDDFYLKDLFPATEKDIITAYSFILNGMVGTPRALEMIRKRKPDDYVFNANLGSNAYAANSALTEDNSAMLCMNPHIPLEGMISWYEVHMHSEEGLNMHGAVFPGMVSPALGCNENLGWGVTFNWPDYVDIYKLEMHPKEKNMYRYDGEWYELEERKIPLRFKTFIGRLRVGKKAYYSIHGPVYKNKDGYYAIRNNAVHNIKHAEQWYKMGKATNFDEYKSALETQGIPLFNFVYADREDNIHYIFQGLLPEREDGYNYQNVLPGDTSVVVWDSFYSVDDLPQVKNPDCGYVYNTNNTPFRSSCADDAPNEADFDTLSAFDWNRINNRDLAFSSIIKGKKQLSFAEFKAMKYTAQYVDGAPLHETVSQLKKLDDSKYDKHRDFINHMLNWDFTGDVDNPHAGAIIVTFTHAFTEKDAGYNEMEEGLELTEKELYKSVKYAEKYLRKRFGTYEVPLGKVQEHIRDEKALPIGGLPEALRSSYVSKTKDKRYKVVSGDTFIMFAHFKDDGSVTYESVVPYGASRNKDSEHYDDQMELYSRNEVKKITLNKDEIFHHAKKTYHPQ